MHKWQKDVSMRIRRTTIRIAGVRTYPKLAEQVRGSRPCLLPMPIVRQLYSTAHWGRDGAP